MPGLWHPSPGGQEGARLSWQLVPTARDPILLPGQLPDVISRILPRKGPSTARAMEANPHSPRQALEATFMEQRLRRC